LEDVELNGYLWPALEKAAEYPDYLVRMCRLAEESGTLDEVMSSLEKYYQREDDIKQSVRSGVIYPLLMSVLMGAVVLILLIKVMPVFRSVYQQLGTDLSGLSLRLFNLGEILRKYALVLVPLLLIVLWLIIGINLSRNQNSFFYKLGSKFKSVREKRELRNASRFTDGMHLGLKAGLGVDSCLELSGQLCEDEDYKSKIEKIRNAVFAGEDMCESFKENNVLNSEYCRLASIGNKSGKLEDAMANISRLCQKEIDENLNNRLALIEPVSVVLLSIFMGVILLSVMLPLLSIMSAL